MNKKEKLREEFYRIKAADYWLKKMAERDQALVEMLKGMRKETRPELEEIPEKYRDPLVLNNETYPIVMRNAMITMQDFRYEQGFNSAIDTIITTLTQGNKKDL